VVLVLIAGDLGDFLTREWQTLKEISIVSALTGVEEFPDIGLSPFFSEEIKGLSIMVRPADGDKCERCWTRSASVGENKEHPVICDRCCTIIADMHIEVK
jgi:isoleucyl-tRNA synthetase